MFGRKRYSSVSLVYKQLKQVESIKKQRQMEIDPPKENATLVPVAISIEYFCWKKSMATAPNLMFKTSCLLSVIMFWIIIEKERPEESFDRLIISLAT